MAALSRSCCHELERSFTGQISRLHNAGYPNAVLVSICESLLFKKKKKKSLREAIDRSKLAVVPYLHGVTHNIKKIAAREG